MAMHGTDPFTWWLNKRATRHGRGPWFNNWRGWARYRTGLWPLFAKIPLIDRRGITIFIKGEVIYLWPWNRDKEGRCWYATEIGGCFHTLAEIDAFWEEYDCSRATIAELEDC